MLFVKLLSNLCYCCKQMSFAYVLMNEGKPIKTKCIPNGQTTSGCCVPSYWQEECFHAALNSNVQVVLKQSVDVFMRAEVLFIYDFNKTFFSKKSVIHPTFKTQRGKRVHKVQCTYQVVIM